MAVITMPDALPVVDFTFGQRRFDLTASSDVSGAQQTRLFGPPRWVCSMRAPPGMTRANAVLWETMLLQLRGRINHLAVWDRENAVPRGSIRGTLTLASSLAAGATSMTLSGSVGTNLLTQSKSFDNAGWSKSQLTVTPNATTAPDGTSTAAKLVEAAFTGNHTASRATPSAVTVGQPYVISVYAKAAERTQIRLAFTAAVFTTGSAYFDLAAGTIPVPAVAPDTSGIESVGNGWYRCWVKAIPESAAAASLIVYPAVAGSSSYAGDGTSGVYVWGAQFEAADAMSAYEPGGGSVKAGDKFQVGTGVGASQLVQATADAQAAENGQVMVAFEPPARIAFSSSTAVAWNKPVAYFKSQNDEWASRAVSPVVFTGHAIDLLEQFT